MIMPTISMQNSYTAIIERIFFNRYTRGAREFEFAHEDIEAAASSLGIRLRKKLGDLIRSFRFITRLPPSIAQIAPKGKIWVIRPSGQATYRFVATTVPAIVPNHAMTEMKIVDRTPGIIEMYAFSDEQALLAKLRYNRLLDVFTGITCYSLQSHLRTTVAGMGQVETDELYVGLDRRGAHYAIPVQAKGGTDRLNIVQIEQDIALCGEKFPDLVCTPVAAQFMERDLIALFAFEEGEAGVGMSMEKHYRLVPPESVTADDLKTYRDRISQI
jgi:hypothetical protein